MEFKEQVKKGFQACKDDIETLFDENQQLHSKLDTLSSENTTLKSELSEKKSLLLSFKEEITSLKQQPTQSSSPPTSSLSNVASATQGLPMQDPYEALLAFKAKSNKREMLKQKMISMVGENGLNLAELKFMIVDHFRYCSKATFYNYLKELELERHIKIERENSKNIVYLQGMHKEI